MKAMVIHEYGDADVFALEDVEPPRPGPEQALVRVHGSSVNPLDTFLRLGAMKTFVQLDLPAILGVDVSGEVVEVGSRTRGFSVGDRVYAYTGLGAGGGYGELAAVSAESLARVPANLDLVAAGTVPGVGATAYEAFSVHAPLEPGMRVFINGAAGGVGTYAIQVAKALGADVTGTCSTPKAELVSRLGAEVVDYTQGDPYAAKHSYDVVLNAVRDAPERELWALLRRGGILVTIVGTPAAPATEVGDGAITVVSFAVSAESTGLEGLSELIAAGTVEPVIEETYPATGVADAHRRVETGRVAGKVSVEVKSLWSA